MFIQKEKQSHDKGAWVQVKAGRHYNNGSKPLSGKHILHLPFPRLT